MRDAKILAIYPYSLSFLQKKMKRSFVTDIEWKPEYVPVLNKLVSDVRALVIRTYLFSRYIFTQELGYNATFNSEEYTVQGFFKEVFLSL
ncbi:hypothetical protein HPULCUR_011034 [Helicostylum pulchrum]|uniref:Uncharacterized protein n=1 Tax=Helicostylum pulchrum TaxID=562976 RepID=A0ABP9YEZ2_9FUNG